MPILGVAALIAILALAWWAYHPGLSGDFLFDDFANLPALGATGPVDNWATFWRYITSGTADPTGRPLTLLTFLIDAHNWPANPYPFKVTNVVLQLINGALLFGVLWHLGNAMRQSGTPAAPTNVGASLAGDRPVTAQRQREPATPVAREARSYTRDPVVRGILSIPPDVGAGLAGDRSATAQRQREPATPVAREARSYTGDPVVRIASPSPPAATPRGERVGVRGLVTRFTHGFPKRTSGNHGSGSHAASPHATPPPSPNPLPRPEDAGERALRGAVTQRAADIPSAERTADVPGTDHALPYSATAIAALFGAGAWLLHPLFVSATLYIVQREAMLPATFVLIGMLGWMAARAALARGHVKRALVGMALSAWLCTVLAVLSKANGALLPILLLLTEWIVLARRPMPDVRTRRRYHGAVAVFLIIPSVLVVGYLISMLPAAIAGAPATRGWTVGQRLLTEPRVLADYLRLLFVPHVHSTGLFNDQFSISKNWLDPRTTLPAIALVLGLIAAGFALRKRHPAIALALLFYFAAQLMESGWIPLELYFEHRNYLPAMLLFWPIGIGLARLPNLRWLGALAAAGILLVLATFTHQRATLWGDGFRQAQVWAAINPDSARAQANAALYDLSHERPRLAAARLRLSLPRHPDDIQAPINLIGAECRLGAVQPGTLAAADRALANTRVGGVAAFKWFNEALGMAARHACSGLDFAALQTTLDAAARNPHWRKVAGRQQDLHHLQGELDLAEGKPDAALASFNRALAVAPNPGSALEQAAYLGSHGFPRLGLAHLDYYATLPPPATPRFGMPRIHAWVLAKEGWWPRETAYLRGNLQQDAAARAAAHATDG